MHTISPFYMARAETWLLLTTLTYFLMNGAQVFETVVIVPKWTRSAPESFLLFKGKYGLDMKTFWITMHSVHELTFMAAIVFCWKLEIRNMLLVLFAIHFAVRLWTLAYFAPKIIKFQKLANDTNPIAPSPREVKRWKDLNYLRVGIFIAVSLSLVPLLLNLLKLNLTLF